MAERIVYENVDLRCVKLFTQRNMSVLKLSMKMYLETATGKGFFKLANFIFGVPVAVFTYANGDLQS